LHQWQLGCSSEQQQLRKLLLLLLREQQPQTLVQCWVQRLQVVQQHRSEGLQQHRKELQQWHRGRPGRMFLQQGRQQVQQRGSCSQPAGRLHLQLPALMLRLVLVLVLLL
jgi:hypothetical protein